MRKFNNKVRDILHKYTTGIVLTQKKLGVNTLVVGDLSGYRKNNNSGHIRNQENHQWLYVKTTSLLKYKCEKKEMMFKLQEESDTTKTCPNCFKEYKCKSRNYRCSHCGFEAHRDMVGCTNILSKYLGTFKFQVVPVMAPGLCVRYHSNAHVISQSKINQNVRLLEAAWF